jgi:hypothetical protein
MLTNERQSLNELDRKEKADLAMTNEKWKMIGSDRRWANRGQLRGRGKDVQTSASEVKKKRFSIFHLTFFICHCRKLRYPCLRMSANH